MLTEYNFNDKFFSQGEISKLKLTRSQKQQACQEHAEEWRQRAGLNNPVEQFCELQKSDPSIVRYRKGGGKEIF